MKRSNTSVELENDRYYYACMLRDLLYRIDMADPTASSLLIEQVYNVQTALHEIHKKLEEEEQRRGSNADKCFISRQKDLCGY